MERQPDIEQTKRFGRGVDFGKAAADYRSYRAGFPNAFFRRLAENLHLGRGGRALDVGTGTGTVARGLASLGLDVVGVDPAEALLKEAAELARQDAVVVDFRTGRAEALDFADETFDLVTAGQCWHWFDRPRAAAEAFRVLKPGGALVIAHFDWLPLPGNVVEATERLILEANPAWAMSGGSGIYPQWLADMAAAGFSAFETQSFDVNQPYTQEAWCGRIRASAGVKASLDAHAVEAFEEKLRNLLKARFSQDPLLVPHRVWWATARRP